MIPRQAIVSLIVRDQCHHSVIASPNTRVHIKMIRRPNTIASRCLQTPYALQIDFEDKRKMEKLVYCRDNDLFDWDKREREKTKVIDEISKISPLDETTGYLMI